MHQRAEEAPAQRQAGARSCVGLCGRRQFQNAWRAYAATTPAGYSLAYNTYQALISLAVKAGRLDAALDTFRDMQGAGLPPNVVTFCGLISALGRERRRRGVRYAQTAYELWSELAASGTQLDAAAYRTGATVAYAQCLLPGPA